MEGEGDGQEEGAEGQGKGGGEERRRRRAAEEEAQALEEMGRLEAQRDQERWVWPRCALLRVVWCGWLGVLSYEALLPAVDAR